VVRNLVVGLDGSASSLGALDWAADTVGRAGRIHAVVGLNPWTRYVVDGIAGREVTFQDALERDLVTDWTAGVRARVRELHTSVSVSTAAKALDAAVTEDRADAVVVGAHTGLPGMPARIGRTINHLVRITDHPVIVVPGIAPVPLDDGVVVVGIGHGNATRAAVRWAAHLARSRNVTVELLHATGDAPIFQADGVLDLVRYEFGRPTDDDDAADQSGDQEAVQSTDQPTEMAERDAVGDQWERGAIDRFAELMRTLSSPELDLVCSTPPGLPAVRLDEASERSALLVLGRHRSKWDRGHHTAQPLRHALTHARCPVAVIADHPDWLLDT